MMQCTKRDYKKVTQLYYNHKNIVVTLDSLKQFRAGERDTLDHLVERHHGLIQVTSKPPVKDYKNYVPVNLSFYDPVIVSTLILVS